MFHLEPVIIFFKYFCAERGGGEEGDHFTIEGPL